MSCIASRAGATHFLRLGQLNITQELGQRRNLSKDGGGRLLFFSKRCRLRVRGNLKVRCRQGEVKDVGDGQCTAWSEVGGRRKALVALAAAAATLAAQNERAYADPGENRKFTDMPAIRGKDYGKSAMKGGPDYTTTDSGLQYKELKAGTGPVAKKGQLAVIDWDGFTIGYYGRIFEARNKAKGGSFEGSEKDFFRFRLGENKVIPAFEEAVEGMRVGSIRRIIVPPELGYPNNDFSKAGPRPQTFSGQRALDFVLKNQGLIDKTLLFDIELIKLES